MKTEVTHCPEAEAEADELAREGVLFSAGEIDECSGGALVAAQQRGWVTSDTYRLTATGFRVWHRMRSAGARPK